MASRAGKAVFDFAKVGAVVPGAVKSEFNAFRNRHDTIRASLTAVPEKPKPVDWAYYKQNVNNAALVASLHKAYEGIKVPYPADTTSAHLKEQEVKMDAEIQAALAQADKNVTMFQTQLAALKAEKPYEDLTVDEYLKEHPAFEKQMREEIRNHNWN